MTPQQHLKLISNECNRLLALSQKRTPGEWKVNNYRPYGIIARSPNESTYKLGDDKFKRFIDTDTAEDADYIANCAERAEAGWKSTICAINLIFALEMNCISELQVLTDILEAWPLELLTK